MTLIRHELRKNRIALAVWTAAVTGFIAVCTAMYPEMEGEMAGVNELFASMGAFTAAFGMDRLNFGTLMGFYAIECGNVLVIGGGFFAALQGISVLAGEQKEGTAEFLLTHPVRRDTVLGAKLTALLLQVAVLNLTALAGAAGTIAVLGYDLPWKELLLLHGAGTICQLQLALLCFGLSAFLRRGGMGIGLGLAVTGYFLNLAGNLTDKAAWLKYLTPFGFTDGADLLSNMALDGPVVLTNTAIALALCLLGWLYYRKKDIL